MTKQSDKSDNILVVQDLVKNFRSQWTYREKPAIKGVSFSVQRNEAFGYLGHNGAGKTTTIKCILGLIHRTSGIVTFEGADPLNPAARAKIGFLPEQPYFYDHLNVQETLNYLACLFGMTRAERRHRVDVAINRLKLTDQTRRAVRTLSKGQQQRLGFAAALLNEPTLLLLDEPFSGLDPLGRIEFKEILTEEKAKGTTIVLSSHILSDIEDLCDRVTIMIQGVIRKNLSLKNDFATLSKGYQLKVRNIDHSNDKLTDSLHAAYNRRIQETPQGLITLFEFQDQQKALLALKDCLSRGIDITSYGPIMGSLEEVFIETYKEAK